MKPIIDLHTHTLASGHAFSTLMENITHAKQNGMQVMGTSDHATAMPGSPHEFYFHNYKVIHKEILGVRVLRGIEANILDDQGTIDVKPDLLAKLDYVIASLHPPCIKPGDREYNTRCLINAMNNPKIKIIGHPDDSRYPLDYDVVAAHSVKTNTALEINNSSLSPLSTRENGEKNVIDLLNACKQRGVKVIMGSDSHICYDVGVFDRALRVLEDVNYPQELIINYDLAMLGDLLGITL